MTLDLKYRITARPDWPPGICCVCMADTGSFIDTGSRFPAWPDAPIQRVFICTSCVEQMAVHTLGCDPPTEKQRKDEAIATLMEELTTAQQEADELRQQLDDIATLRAKGFTVAK